MGIRGHTWLEFVYIHIPQAWCEALRRRFPPLQSAAVQCNEIVLQPLLALSPPLMSAIVPAKHNHLSLQQHRAVSESRRWKTSSHCTTNYKD